VAKEFKKVSLRSSQILGVLAAVLRALIFLGVWIVLSGADLKAIPVGTGAAALASWISLRLLPPAVYRPRFWLLAMLPFRFVWESVVAGIDVARRALDPRLPLRPGFVTYPIRIPPSPARNLFCALSSLLPGTLPTGLDESGGLVVHCLDVGQPVIEQMAAEERNLIRALGEPN
jgi:multicomponent Na+:H+ antiporter subunit E